MRRPVGAGASRARRRSDPAPPRRRRRRPAEQRTLSSASAATSTTRGRTVARCGDCTRATCITAEPEALPAELIPHLVSRLIYTGAGGFVNTAPGLEFVLSPRTPHLVRDVSRDSTSNRGIFHDKRAHLAGGGHHRLHVLCGESLCSGPRHLAPRRHDGVGGGVLAEAGLRPGRGSCRAIPVAAMQTFARDPTCRARVPIVGGEALTAIDIQWHYLTYSRRLIWKASSCRPGRGPYAGSGAPCSIVSPRVGKRSRRRSTGRSSSASTAGMPERRGVRVGHARRLDARDREGLGSPRAGAPR